MERRVWRVGAEERRSHRIARRATSSQEGAESSGLRQSSRGVPIGQYTGESSEEQRMTKRTQKVGERYVMLDVVE